MKRFSYLVLVIIFVFLITNCVEPSPKIVYFSCSSDLITKGETVTLAWATNNADVVSINQGIGVVNPIGSMIISPNSTTEYIITASNGKESTEVTLLINVKEELQPPVIISFSANPTSIISGNSSTLSWQTTGATSVSINQNIGAVSLDGTRNVSPTTTTTYTLTATNSSGSSTATVTVTVGAALPVIDSFTANPTSIISGNSSTLSWQTTGATSVSINQNIGAVSLDGTRSVSPTTTTTYTLTATNSSGSSTATVTISVTNSIILTVNPTSVNFGEKKVGGITEMNITISNSTRSSSNLIGNVSITGEGFSIIGGSGCFSIEPGKSRYVTIRFLANYPGNYSGSLKITHNATNTSTPYGVPLSGSAIIPIFISTSQSSIDFGVVTAGQSIDRNLTIRNSSNSDANLIGRVSISGTGFSIISGSGSFNLSPGQSNTVTVRFSPKSNGGTVYSGSINITHNAINHESPIIVPLQGKGGPIYPINVTIPNNRTIWGTGEKNVPIRWTTGNLGGSVNIYLYKGNTQLFLIETTENDGSYNWDVPLGGMDLGTNFRIRVYYDSYNYDMSDYFEIDMPWAALIVYFDNGNWSHATNVDDWKDKLWLVYSDPMGTHPITDPSWNDCFGDVQVFTPKNLNEKQSIYISEYGPLSLKKGLTIDPSCSYIGVALQGSLEQYTGAGGLWVQTNYNNCPQMRFNFRDNNCQTQIRTVDNQYFYSDNPTHIKIGYDNTNTLFGLNSGAIKQISFQFVGWRITSKGDLVKNKGLIMNDEE